MEDITIEKKILIRNKVAYTNYEMYSSQPLGDAFQVSDAKFLIEHYKELANGDFMHGHNFNMIMWIKKGEGTHYVDFEKYEIDRNTIFFLSPNNLHRYEATEADEGYSIIFTTDFLEHIDKSVIGWIDHVLFSRNNGATLCYVSNETSERLETIITMMLEEQQTGYVKDMHVTCFASLLTLFLITISRECIWPSNDVNGKTNKHSFVVYTNFLKEVENNFMKFHTVKYYCDKLGVSVSLLTKYTQEFEKRTPLKIIIERIIIAAKRMLRYSTLSIKEISLELGYDDPSYFSKFFKRYTGLLPADFRENA